MKIIENMIQGTESWHHLRKERFTASEASAVFGQHKYMSRSDLLQLKYTGVQPEVSPSQQRIFDAGHKAEAQARIIVEEMIGTELYPCTVEDDTQTYLASMDGLDVMGELGFEHKLASASLMQQIEAEDIEDHYKWQMDHQMMVSGAEKILFVASDGTREHFACMWYNRDENRIRKLIEGWKQFDADLKNYQPKQQTVEAVGTAPDSLPALSIEITGSVTASNLPQFKERALAMIQGINTELSTDQDFADADSTVKFLKKGEKQLDDSKQAALQQTATISELFTTIDDLREQMRQKRLQLEKLVKAEKENRRNEILIDAQASFLKWLDDQHSPVYCQPRIDLSGAMKGKKTIDSLKSAADDEVARAKIEATRAIESIKSNDKLLSEQGQGYEFLFSDREQLLIKSPDDLAATIKARIADHKEREEQRLQAERERMKQEEENKAFTDSLNAQEEDAKASQEAEARSHGIDTRRLNAAAKRYQNPVETITVERDEYQRLLEDSEELAALKAFGVESWKGYGEAIKSLEAA